MVRFTCKCMDGSGFATAGRGRRKTYLNIIEAHKHLKSHTFEKRIKRLKNRKGDNDTKDDAGGNANGDKKQTPWGRPRKNDGEPKNSLGRMRSPKAERKSNC